MAEMPDLPSLDLVRTEVDSVAAEQGRRGTSFDSRAGFLLGLGGVLIGLTFASGATLYQLVGQVVAALGGAAAIAAMVPRAASAIAPRMVRDRYLVQDPAITKLRMLDTAIAIYEVDEKRLQSKARWLRVSVVLIAFAVASLLTGSIVDFATVEAR